LGRYGETEKDLKGRCNISTRTAIRVVQRVVGDCVNGEGSRLRVKLVSEFVSNNNIVALRSLALIELMLLSDLDIDTVNFVPIFDSSLKELSLLPARISNLLLNGSSGIAIPYQTNKSSLVMKIAELIQNKTLDGISDIRDESDRSGMRIVIELQRGYDPSIVLNNLYRFTALQSSFSCNMVGMRIVIEICFMLKFEYQIIDMFILDLLTMTGSLLLRGGYKIRLTLVHRTLLIFGFPRLVIFPEK
ncbi:DNA gyrase subunit A, chloroplastic/mitochondrial, partial [Tanacetum coccineum]